MAKVFGMIYCAGGELGVVSCTMAFGDLHPPARMVLSGHLNHRDAPTKDKGGKMRKKCAEIKGYFFVLSPHLVEGPGSFTTQVRFRQATLFTPSGLAQLVS
jgi:hypothetical protein